ncbi:MAG: hypothetical protein WDM96_10190 [Lacunisphaera sp.]
MTARKVPVTNSSLVFADPCAQHVVAQMLALVRNLPVQLRNQDGPREWRYLNDRFSATTLTGRRVVLLGYGAIGRGWRNCSSPSVATSPPTAASRRATRAWKS